MIFFGKPVPTFPDHALVNDTFDGNGGGFTAADAECRDAAL